MQKDVLCVMVYCTDGILVTCALMASVRDCYISKPDVYAFRMHKVTQCGGGGGVVVVCILNKILSELW
jgi:hypothetical protein